MRLIGISLIFLLMLTPVTAFASAPPAGKPSITIVSPGPGATIHGSSVTVRVNVSHFRLVKPVLLGPKQWHTIPLLKGNQGHIHYVLDSMANMVLTRDVVVKTDHTWTNVSPGHHTIIAYLATSQHAPFPGVPAAKIRITVAPNAQPRRMQTNSPSIAITGYRITQSTGGATVLVGVKVSRFKLVPPILKNPPLLSGNEGHIHYVLDSLSHFVASRDAETALYHPWSNVTPGRHTLIAYLANSQHQLFPGTKPAEIQITVPRSVGSRGTTLRVGTLPPTGGAAQEPPASQPAARWTALLAIPLGLGLMVWAYRRRPPVI